ncbi:NUDIX domain-containing protein [Oxyplasma meridianum]|uniref:NUDIX domain-containing protein n=1 Tax=Oxyplasma meridianum TaxID=3073602 RepID=A0AAX4NID6_9ARCH
MENTREDILHRSEAAVGIVYCKGEILLIKRMEREDDPWTGQIALPGGFSRPGEMPQETVIREVMEEVNMGFSKESIFAQLEPKSPNRASWVKVYPFILKAESLTGYSPGPEVSEVRKVRLDVRVPSHTESGYESFIFQDWIVWGLTYRILVDFIAFENKPV